MVKEENILKYLVGMACKNIYLDQMTSLGAPLSKEQKVSFLIVAMWIIDNDYLPGGDQLEISSCGTIIKKRNIYKGFFKQKLNNKLKKNGTINQ